MARRLAARLILASLVALSMALAAWLLMRSGTPRHVRLAGSDDQGGRETMPDYLGRGAPAAPGSIRARGTLVLIGELRQELVCPATIGDADEAKATVARMLVTEALAPLAAFHAERSVVPLGDAIVLDVWQVSGNTPEIPPPPEQLAGARAGGWWLHFAGGSLSAAVYAPSSPGGPCTLTVRVGQRGLETELSHEISEDTYRVSGTMTPFGASRGLLIDLHASVGQYDDLRRIHHVYVCHAPEWQPELLHKSRRFGWVLAGGLRGVAADGNTVFLDLRDSGDAKSDLRSLYRVRPRDRELTRVCDHVEGAVGLIPSPDGHFLGGQVDLAFDIASPWQNPLTIVDLDSGAVHTVTDRASGGFYYDTALAWSAEVPGRLYFLDSDDRIWRLDLALDEGFQPAIAAGN